MKYFFPLVFTLLTVLSCKTGMGSLEEPLKDGNIYDINRKVVSQQFDIDRKGNAYYAEIREPGRWMVTVFRIAKDSLNREGETEGRGEEMNLGYAGHPTGMAVENAKDGPHVWISSYSSRISNGSYWDTQTISRVRYTPGKTFLPEDPQLEHFWLPHRGSINVALDEKNDQVAFSFYRIPEDSEGIPPGRSRRVRIYRLSEALALPEEEITLPDPWIRGGEGEPYPDDSLSVTIRARNLTRLTPVAEIGTHTGGDNPEKINSTAWQGFDIDRGRVWFSEGGGHTGTYVTAYDYTGEVVFHRTLAAVSVECEAWERYRLTDTEKHCMENEGIRVWNGSLCLGFFSVRSDTGSRSGILRYPLPD